MWQPIETAPGPDVPVLVWDGKCTVGRKTTHGSWFVDDTYGFCEDGQIYDPTHWQPLPAGPNN